MGGVLLIEARFVVYEFDRQSVRRRGHFAIFVLLKPLSQVAGITGVEVSVLEAAENVDVKEFAHDGCI